MNRNTDQTAEIQRLRLQLDEAKDEIAKLKRELHSEFAARLDLPLKNYELHECYSTSAWRDSGSQRSTTIECRHCHSHKTGASGLAVECMTYGCAELSVDFTCSTCGKQTVLGISADGCGQSGVGTYAKAEGGQR